jgi:hypothetical protein
VSGGASTYERLLAACHERGFVVTGDGRVSEIDAAELLGLTPGSLKNKRLLGCAPPHYRRPAGNSRVSYRLTDLADWIDEAREDF